MESSQDVTVEIFPLRLLRHLTDPALDLDDLVGACKPRFRTCLSTALVRNGALVGILTLYSPNRKGFSDEQIRIVETLTAAVAEPVAMRTPA